MKLIVGLGNPGEKYKLNRHNVGFLVLEELRNKITKFQITNNKQISNLNFQLNKKLQAEIVKTDDLILAKPVTFMNRSGESVSSLATYYKLPTTNIYIIYDDLDIMLGEYKIVKGKGPREHKGLLSIYDSIGSKNFWHIRVGIENRKKMENGKWKMENRVSGEDYVLMNFTEEEMNIVQDVVEEIADRLLELIKE